MSSIEASCGCSLMSCKISGTAALTPIIETCFLASIATGPEKVKSTGVYLTWGSSIEGGGGGSRPAFRRVVKVFFSNGIRFSFWSRVTIGCKRVACSPCMAWTWAAVILLFICDIIENISALNILVIASRLSFISMNPAWSSEGNFKGSILSWGLSRNVTPPGWIFSFPFIVPVAIWGGSTRSCVARRLDRAIC